MTYDIYIIVGLMTTLLALELFYYPRLLRRARRADMADRQVARQEEDLEFLRKLLARSETDHQTAQKELGTTKKRLDYMLALLGLHGRLHGLELSEVEQQCLSLARDAVCWRTFGARPLTNEQLDEIERRRSAGKLDSREET